MPIVRMTNTFIEKGADKPADILASTPSGIYVQSLSGGSVNPTDGVFNFTCREAYLIENGQKTMPVKGATLIGNCLDVIQGVDAVGRRPRLRAGHLRQGPGGRGHGRPAHAQDPGHQRRRLAGPLSRRKDDTMDNKAIAETAGQAVPRRKAPTRPRSTSSRAGT